MTVCELKNLTNEQVKKMFIESDESVRAWMVDFLPSMQLHVIPTYKHGGWKREHKSDGV